MCGIISVGIIFRDDFSGYRTPRHQTVEQGKHILVAPTSLPRSGFVQCVRSRVRTHW